MNTRIGTCHFITFYAAAKHFAAYNGEEFPSQQTELLVHQKLAAGEIAIGRPEGQNVKLDKDGRYWRDM